MEESEFISKKTFSPTLGLFLHNTSSNSLLSSVAIQVDIIIFEIKTERFFFFGVFGEHIQRIGSVKLLLTKKESDLKIEES